MPVFKVTLRKATQVPNAVKWSNSYYVLIDTIVNAGNRGLDIWNSLERPFHNSDAYCYEIYASDLLPNTSTYVNFAVPLAQQRGNRVLGGDVLPFFNVIRVDLPVLGGRPSRKFYRLPLRDADVDANQAPTPALVGIMAGQLIATNINQLGLRDESGNGFTGDGQVRGVTSRRLGREAGLNVPPAPPSG